MLKGASACCASYNELSCLHRALVRRLAFGPKMYRLTFNSQLLVIVYRLTAYFLSTPPLPH